MVPNYYFGPRRHQSIGRCAIETNLPRLSNNRCRCRAFQGRPRPSRRLAGVKDLPLLVCQVTFMAHSRVDAVKQSAQRPVSRRLVELLPDGRQFAVQTTRVAKPELSGMSLLRSGQSTLDAWVRPFRRTTLQLRLRTQESAAALLPGTVPSTIRTSKDRKKRASRSASPPNPYRP